MDILNVNAKQSYNTSMLAKMNSQAVPQIRFNKGEEGLYHVSQYLPRKIIKKTLTIISVQRKLSSRNSSLPSTTLHNTPSCCHTTQEWAIRNSLNLLSRCHDFDVPEKKKCNNTTSWQSRHILYQGRIY